LILFAIVTPSSCWFRRFDDFSCRVALRCVGGRCELSVGSAQRASCQLLWIIIMMIIMIIYLFSNMRNVAQLLIQHRRRFRRHHPAAATSTSTATVVGCIIFSSSSHVFLTNSHNQAGTTVVC
jgi:amino acid transporter